MAARPSVTRPSTPRISDASASPLSFVGGGNGLTGGKPAPVAARAALNSGMSRRVFQSVALSSRMRLCGRTARAKGVFEQTVVFRHAMGNALLPAITLIGLEFAFLMGGLVVTEQVFNLNGIGRLFVEAVARNDFTLIQALVMLIAVMFIVINLLVDLMYGVLDPRIRYR